VAVCLRCSDHSPLTGDQLDGYFTVDFTTVLIYHHHLQWHI